MKEMRPTFAETFLRSDAVFVTDGGIETRLIYEFGLDLPDFASFLALFDERGRKALEEIYRSYLAIAAQSRVPMLVGTPTWRAHSDCLKRLGFSEAGDLDRVNREAVAFLQALRRELDVEDRVFIAGVIGPRGDGYRADAVPQSEEAHAYHRPQAQLLAQLGVDFLYAPTFASRAELMGVALAMAETGRPYALAPVIDGNGLLPDGSVLSETIRLIDDAVRPAPLYYLTGCVHSSTFRKAAEDASDTLVPLMPGRITGMKANASPLPPDQLDRLDHVEADEPAVFASNILDLRRRYGLRILGGCCGTGAGHIRALAEGLSIGPPSLLERDGR